VIIPKTYENWQVNNFFKLFFASRCLHHDMILIHASMIIRSGTAVLFIGQSGAGKSTISNLSGYPVVHDDNVALTITGDNKFLCRSIPFKEPYHKKSFEGSIDCIYRLFQSHTTFLKEVPLPQQYMYLLFSLWSFDGFENAATREYNKQVAGYLQRIHKMTCVKELHFEKNKAFMELI
jgi:energy-coupling factor transporter ATP-binding protein EcfA2